jgi:hypothetical protein
MTMGTDCIRPSALAGFLLLAAGASAAGEPPPTPTINGNVIEGVRNARYCEIIPIVRDGLHLVATVYNTLGLNDCPAQVWGGITEDAMKQRFGAVTVLLNGPRFFLMDSITASGPTKTGEQIEAGGLSLAERATIDVGLLDLLHRPYREQTINRDTVYLLCIADAAIAALISHDPQAADFARVRVDHGAIADRVSDGEMFRAGLSRGECRTGKPQNQDGCCQILCHLDAPSRRRPSALDAVIEARQLQMS